MALAVTAGTRRSPWQPPGSTNLDGLLGTGTYIVVPGETESELLGQMIDRFDAAAAAAGLSSAAAAAGRHAVPGGHGGVDRAEGGHLAR